MIGVSHRCSLLRRRHQTTPRQKGQRPRRARALPSPIRNPPNSRHGHPPPQRGHGQPHRRRRGGRAAGERGQGAGRERDRRRRARGSRSSPPRAASRSIRVSDDGAGIARDDLALAVERHCTSKLDGGLDDIRTLGFRGEALAAIGAAARLTLASRARRRGGRLGDRGRGRRGRADPAGGAAAGHAGRGARPLLRDAGAAQVPEVGARRGGGDHRRGEAPGDGPPGSPLHALRQRPDRDRLSGRRRRRARRAASRR